MVRAAQQPECFRIRTEVWSGGTGGFASGMKILIVDDHALIREALGGALKALRADIQILEAVNCRQATHLVEETGDLDLILLDLNLPDRDGFSLLTELRENHPGVSVVVLSAHDDRNMVTRALDLGALGFIPKNADREVMLSALQLIFAGGVYIPPQALDRGQPPARPAVFGNTAELPDLGLTGRQVEVLQLMSQGKSNKAICRALGLAEPTVKNHVTAILKALKVSNRTEAAIAINDLKSRSPR
jgi:DNA-binding NarL/FixJ family response regulator